MLLINRVPFEDDSALTQLLNRDESVSIVLSMILFSLNLYSI